MNDPFCPEVSPASGTLCGVSASIVHSRHFAKNGAVWDTPVPYRAPVEKAVDWLWEQLGIDPDRVDPEEFRRLLGEYELRLNRQRWHPPQSLVLISKDAPGPMMLRPCWCCHCTGDSLCFHPDNGGCWWKGPGR
jgi:hypothetical protein